MYANTLTPTTKVKDSGGQFVVLGKQYACMFNAQWVQLLRYCLAAAVATTCCQPCIACSPNLLGLLKTFLDIFPKRAGLSPPLSIHSACREGVCTLHQLAKFSFWPFFYCSFLYGLFSYRSSLWLHPLCEMHTVEEYTWLNYQIQWTKWAALFALVR